MTDTMGKKDTPIKDAAILVIITLVAALLLALVYEITKEPIAAMKLKKKTESYESVFPGLKDSCSSQELTKKALSFVGDGASIEEALLAIDENDEIAGILLTVTTKEGYGGEITITAGMTLDGTLTGISFLTLAETAGLGMKAKDDAFKNQFANKKTSAFGLSKPGNTPIIHGGETIDAISNATITSKAVVRAVNVAVSFANEVREDGLEGYKE